MVIIIDNDNYWNELSKYKNLPYSFILFNQESFNWSNIFEYSRYKSNTKFIIKFEKYWINNQNAISNIFSLYKLSEKNVTFYLEYKSEKVFLEFDLDQISRVLVNIIKNSLKFCVQTKAAISARSLNVDREILKVTQRLRPKFAAKPQNPQRLICGSTPQTISVSAHRNHRV